MSTDIEFGNEDIRKAYLVFIGLFLVLYVLPLGIRPVIIPDEYRYAEIPREMIASGDWVVPRLDGLRYFEKPVLGYWINAGAMVLFGENAFAMRFPSALSVGISSLMLFLLVRRFAGGPYIGGLAAIIFLTTLEVYGIGTFNILDSMVSMFITVSMGAFFFAYQEDRPLKKNSLLILAGVFCGLAFLTKGFIAFAIPVIAIVPFLLWERYWKGFFRIWWIPVVSACVIILPWALMIHMQEPDFWHFFFWNEHIKRFLAQGAQHSESFWYFLMLLPVATLPWVCLFPAAVLGMGRERLKNPVTRFAVCWFLFPFLFFSASHGKMITYILPCFPPLALLVGVGIYEYLKQGRTKAFTAGALLLALVAGILGSVVLVLSIVGLQDIKPYAEAWKWVMWIVGLFSWMIILVFSVKMRGHRQKIMLYGAAPVLFLLLLPMMLPDPTLERKAPGDFLAHHSPEIGADTILVSDEALVHAVCWVYKRNDVYLLENPGELSYGLSHDDSKHRLLTLKQFSEWAIQNRGEKGVVLIAKVKKYKEWQESLPEPVLEDRNSSSGFVFVRY